MYLMCLCFDALLLVLFELELPEFDIFRIPDLLPPLKLTIQDVFAEMKELVMTFRSVTHYLKHSIILLVLVTRMGKIIMLMIILSAT